MTNPSLGNKVAVVTGAAGGIGRSITLALAKAGAKVLAVDREGKGVEETCSMAGDGAAPLVVDLLRDGAETEVVEGSVGAFGGLDVLVNCAGVFPTSPALELPVEEWDRVLGLNLRAPFLLSRAAADWMVRESRPGNVVNIASTAGSVARPGIAHYAASKAGLVMLTKVLAIE